MCMRILVLGWYYSDNYGDAVLTECTAALLHRKYPHAELVIRDLMGRDTFPTGKSMTMHTLYRRRILLKSLSLVTGLGWDWWLRHEQWLLRKVRDRLPDVTAGAFDAAVFAGGQLFMDEIALYVEDAALRLRQRNIPVLFNACGIGPSRSVGIQRRLAAALGQDHVRYVSCRDDVERLNRWCGSPIAVPVSDPALYAGSVYGVRKDPASKTVGLGIMYASTMPVNGSYRFWRRMIRELEKQQIPWKIFTNGCAEDMAFARHILASLPELTGPEARYLCPPPTGSGELVKLIASFESIISYRLHSHIIACSLDIPTVAIQWDSKLPFFFSKIGCPERCLTTQATPQLVLERLQQARVAGYHRDEIQRQQEESCEKLFAALDTCLVYGETP